MTEPRLYGQLYYEQAKLAMQKRKASVLPEHTTQSEHDPLNAAIAVKAHDHHGLVTMLDVVLAELSWESATRRGSFVALGLANGYRPARDVPAAADVLFDLTGTPSPTAQFMPAGASFGVGGSPRLRFEAVDAIAAPGALSLQYRALFDKSVGTYAAWTDGAALWGEPVEVDDTLYLGHPHFMFDRFTVTPSAVGNDTLLAEYFDNHWLRAAPFSVALTPTGNGLRVYVDNVLLDGFATAALLQPVSCKVRVTLKKTGAYEEAVTAAGTGTTAYVDLGFLGQTSPSVAVADYEVSSEWLPLPLQSVSAAVVGQPLTRIYTLPETSTRKWQKTTVNSNAGFFVRLRAIVAPAGTNWAFSSASIPTGTKWTGRAYCLQGETLLGVSLGSTSGLALQELETGRVDLIEGGLAALYVAGVLWTGVANLYDAGSADVAYEEFERPRTGVVGVRFGDGTNGSIPAASQAVTADIRISAETDGNVAAAAIDRALSGIAGVTNIRNARPAAGWFRKEAADPDDELALARTRRRGPAAYRARGRALTPDDIIYLLTDKRSGESFVASDGTRPVSRAQVILEGAGPKTAKVAVVGANGTTLSATHLADAKTYLVGTQRYQQRFGGVLVENQDAEVVNYTAALRSYTVTATVLASLIATATGQATMKATILALLDKYVDPLAPPIYSGATEEWLWAMGQEPSLDLVRAALAANMSGLVSLALTTAGPSMTTYGLPRHNRAVTTIALTGI